MFRSTKQEKYPPPPLSIDEVIVCENPIYKGIYPIPQISYTQEVQLSIHNIKDSLGFKPSYWFNPMYSEWQFMTSLCPL